MILRPLLCFIVLASLPLTLCAESSTPAPPITQSVPVPTSGQDKNEYLLDGNYVVTLTPVGKDATGFSVITAKRDFGLVFGANSTIFDATLHPQKNGIYLLEYRLKSTYGIIEITSSVLLRLGEPVQIVKNNDMFYNLRLDRYPASEPAKTGTEH